MPEVTRDHKIRFRCQKGEGFRCCNISAWPALFVCSRYALVIFCNIFISLLPSAPQNILRSIYFAICSTALGSSSRWLRLHKPPSGCRNTSRELYLQAKHSRLSLLRGECGRAWTLSTRDGRQKGRSGSKEVQDEDCGAKGKNADRGV